MSHVEDTGLEAKSPLLAEIAALRRQLAESAQRTEALLSLGPMQRSARPPTDFTIAGLEECVLIVTPALEVYYCNSGMAQLLGAQGKQAVLNTPLARWDGLGQIPRGVLITLVDGVRSSGSTIYTEQHSAAAGDNAGPGPEPNHAGIYASTARHAHITRTLRFVASPVADQRVQIIVQDVSYLRWVERSFARYVAPAVIQQLAAQDPAELLRTERRQVSVLFSDLRGFTTLCQREAPDAVCGLLNEHFQHVIAAIQAQQGTVLKLIGDSVMAVFGAPLPNSAHALQALLAANAMLQAHRQWDVRRQSEACPSLALSVGVASGEVVFGNIGTPELMDYTVLGHTVNLASRLVGQAAPWQLLTEPETHRRALDALMSTATEDMPYLRFEPVGQAVLKNVAEPVDVLEAITQA